ncbi:MAG: DNA polymerase I [Acidobacteria bacterium]|nr:DNA polymerase I [Acidobacteriota bacterium]
MKRKTVYIIDVMSQVYRAYYAISRLSNSANLPTNAVFGFAAIMNKLIDSREPDYLVAATDTDAPTLRHAAYAEYKATRPDMPPELHQQIPLIYELCAAFRIPVLQREGYEADDIIATLAREARSRDCEVYIISRDKDLFQLVQEHVFLLDIQDDVLYDARQVEEKTGVPPGKIRDYLALVGDTSDNIPGAPGIGPKTAARLLADYDRLEECYDSLAELTPPRLRDILAEHRDTVFKSRELVTLQEAPLEFRWNDFEREKPDHEKLRELYTRLEFKSLLQSLPNPSAAPSEDVQVSTDATAFRDLAARQPDRPVAVYPLDEDRLLLGPAGSDTVFILSWPENMEVLAEWLSSPHPKRFYRSKPLLFRHEFAPAEQPLTDDLKLLHYVLRPHVEDHSLEKIALDATGTALNTPAETGPRRRSLLDALEESPTSLRRKTEVIHQATAGYLEQTTELGLQRVYRDLELPLVPVLVDMERNGILLDTDYLDALSGEMAEKIKSLEEQIYILAGEEFNINSPKQLGVILFEKLGLPSQKKTKKTKSYATGVDVLEQLAIEFELPAHILAYRRYTKLKSTYVDALPRLVSSRTGRVHTTFHQTVAATGRLSSSNPNLQNIPIRTEEGQKIRRAFITPAGHWLVSADYSQIELRIMAHLSGDQRLIAAFHGDTDVHRQTARDVFGDRATVHPAEYRHKAKAINYGIIYGQSDFGLAGELNINRSEAREIIDSYFITYPQVRAWIDDNIRTARETGVVKTLFGRIRPLPELSHSNWNIQKFGERVATNAPVQGSAADIIKMAMLEVHRRLRQEGLAARLLLQVHDELVLECPEPELEALTGLIRECMEQVVTLKVPLTVDIHHGRNWLEAK